jgi:hypothetical protein
MRSFIVICTAFLLFSQMSFGQENKYPDQSVWLYHADIQYNKMHVRGYLSIVYSNECLSHSHNHDGTTVHQEEPHEYYYRAVVANKGNQFVDVVFFTDSIRDVYWAPGLNKLAVKKHITNKFREVIDQIKSNNPREEYILKDPTMNLSILFRLPEKSNNP